MTVPVEIFDSLDSTSLEAKRRAESGQVVPCWILARQQTAGYGRRGDGWESTRGNLHATRLFPLLPADPPASELSFVAAIAIAEAIEALAQTSTPQLKWPNDVYIDDAKICGLLPELIARASGRQYVALGVGLNIAVAPCLADRKTTRLAKFLPGPVPTPEDVLDIVEGRFDRWLAEWRRDGFAPIAAAWTERAYGLGRMGWVVDAGPTISGVIEGLATDGALCLNDGGRIVMARAGSLRFNAPDA